MKGLPLHAYTKRLRAHLLHDFRVSERGAIGEAGVVLGVRDVVHEAARRDIALGAWFGAGGLGRGLIGIGVAHALQEPPARVAQRVARLLQLHGRV